MNWNFQQMNELFSQNQHNHLLLDGKWGLEKEAQRITPSGDLALTSHPAIFGDKSKNPLITTDFSESQLELITPPFSTIEETYSFLTELQTTAEVGIGDELLWPLSMPPRLPDEEQIPIANFGDEENSKEREVYRRGLALRYGKKMQMISGIHYNFSFGMELLEVLYRQFGSGKEKQVFINDLYFVVARNFLRYRWLLIYLFGSSPNYDLTYQSVISKELKLIEKCCPGYCGMIMNYQKYAASLRVSRFGYSNQELGNEGEFYNDIDAYIRGIRELMATRSQAFKRLGIYKNGSRIQLNDHVLQKESEFYAPIRFKQSVHKEESQLEALESRGVQYLEVRILDLDPFERIGISLGQLRFLQVFMLYCLFESSPMITDYEFLQMNVNHHSVALFGRVKDVNLMRDQERHLYLQDWGWEIFLKLKTIADLIERFKPGNVYSSVICQEAKKIVDISFLPSARIVNDMKQNREGFLEFGVRKALTHKRYSVEKESRYGKSRIPGVGVIDPNSHYGSTTARS